MTPTEYKNEFLTKYDKVSSNDAPGLDDYEISLFLTDGQEMVAKRYFNPKGNKYGVGFEMTEKRRKDLNELVIPYSASPQTTDVTVNKPNGVFVNIPEETWYVVNETAIVNSSDACVNGKIAKIVPKTHDEYEREIDDPFSKPYANSQGATVWRLDISRGASKRQELITGSDFSLSTYNMRYLKRPAAIIVGNISPETINGVSGPQTSELGSIDREIINEAVKLALEANQERRLQTFAQTSAGSE